MTLDLKLEVGNMTESVTVQGEAALLSTGTASVGVVVDSAQIDSLPMSGRAPVEPGQASAGVLDDQPGRQHAARSTTAARRPSPSAAGRARTSDLLLDGGPNMARDRRISYNPPADIVQEITIETFQSDASYGNTAVGHGEHRHEERDQPVPRRRRASTRSPRACRGRTSSPSAPAGTEPPFTYNQGGVTAGGPLVIPRVIDGRNRVFWIASYDNIRDSYVTPVTTTVPTEAMRSGDFSELLGLGDVYRIYDPLTGVAEGERRRRQPFAEQRIPADRINPIARRISTTIRCRTSQAAPTAPATTSRRPRARTPTTA